MITAILYAPRPERESGPYSLSPKCRRTGKECIFNYFEWDDCAAEYFEALCDFYERDKRHNTVQIFDGGIEAQVWSDLCEHMLDKEETT